MPADMNVAGFLLLLLLLLLFVFSTGGTGVHSEHKAPMLIGFAWFRHFHKLKEVFN